MNGLVNLSDIKLEEGLKGKERLQAFLIQIKAPYHYQDSEWEVTNRFTGLRWRAAWFIMNSRLSNIHFPASEPHANAVV